MQRLLVLNASTAAPPVSPEVAQITVAREERRVERPVDKPDEKLHGHILERQGGPVKELEQPLVRIDLDERGNRRVIEIAIGVIDHALKLDWGNRAVHEWRNHGMRQLGIGAPTQSLHRRVGQPRPFGGYVKAAVAGEARQHDLLETEDWCFAPG